MTAHPAPYAKERNPAVVDEGDNDSLIELCGKV